MSLLAGCFGPKPEEELYTAFENAAKQEKTMFEDVKKLEQLEKEGQELYAQILEEGKENNEAVQVKLDEAMKNVDAREDVLKKEKAALDKAQEEVKSVDVYIKELEDKKLKTQAEKVSDAYTKRYNSFKKMEGSYINALKLEKELYTMLQADDTKLKPISEKVNVINGAYQEIDAQQQEFNEFTKQYNEEKMKFYKQAEIKVKEEKK